MTDFIVTEIPGMTAAELYKETDEWIIRTFVHPEEVVVARIENELIKIWGISRNTICVNYPLSMECQDARYLIIYEFREARYKMTVQSMEGYNSARHEWQEWKIDDLTGYTNKKTGEFKVGWRWLLLVPQHLNRINTDLARYLNGSDRQDTEDW